MKDKKALTASCGLECFNYEVYEDNLQAKILFQTIQDIRNSY